MIKIMKSSTYETMLDRNRAQIEHIDMLIKEIDSLSRKQRQIDCGAKNCMDNEKGQCVLQRLCIGKDGVCADFDVAGAMEEFVEELKSDNPLLRLLHPAKGKRQ